MKENLSNEKIMNRNFLPRMLKYNLQTQTYLSKTSVNTSKYGLCLKDLANGSDRNKKLKKSLADFGNKIRK